MTGWIRPNAEPNVTPMIDVMLVLIIVFMVVVIQGRRTMDVQLPEQCVEATCGAGEAIVLEVLGRADFRLNQRPVRGDSLLQVLTSVYAGRPNKVLSITGRPGATYANVMDAMDVAREAGVRVLSTVPKGL
jgi:biopolymer transport protein ExbD